MASTIKAGRLKIRFIKDVDGMPLMEVKKRIYTVIYSGEEFGIQDAIMINNWIVDDLDTMIRLDDELFTDKEYRIIREIIRRHNR